MLRVVSEVFTYVSAAIAFMSSISPPDAISNLGRWAKFFGINPPNWLRSQDMERKIRMFSFIGLAGGVLWIYLQPDSLPYILPRFDGNKMGMYAYNDGGDQVNIHSFMLKWKEYLPGKNAPKENEPDTKIAFIPIPLPGDGGAQYIRDIPLNPRAEEVVVHFGGNISQDGQMRVFSNQISVYQKNGKWRCAWVSGNSGPTALKICPKKNKIRP